MLQLTEKMSLIYGAENIRILLDLQRHAEPPAETVRLPDFLIDELADDDID